MLVVSTRLLAADSALAEAAMIAAAVVAASLTLGLLSVVSTDAVSVCCLLLRSAERSALRRRRPRLRLRASGCSSFAFLAVAVD